MNEKDQAENYAHNKQLRVECALGTWMPIETAPKKERVLLWNGTGMYCGHWAKSIETDDEAWIIAEFGNDGDQLLIKATHWMPLPAPPV